ncbi:hypothetical protein [Nocardia aurantia]|uniref:Sulfatase-modifying factor enzyme domain-containing protein n=1 Tax=Nocardia aurantia TaxID=2585199 RepID=A0A7K0DZR4_9NOCA|nr:hypothetical protein [Nocardia aurantia]MQY31320.1 hypothetical protein [Nocardia aurantia]
MPHADLTAERWRELSDEAALRVARAIARENAAELLGIHPGEYAGRRHRTARFERAGLRLSLVPAARARLGYEGDRFVPSPHQSADYADSAAEYGLPPLAEYIDTMTSPDRVVDLPAMLVGVEALEPRAEVTHEQASEKLSALGVRPSTPDEWEYACGAGATTLFRWGDDTPDTGYPFDHSAGAHRKPNLWGLSIGQDPYRHEFTTERGIVCGGDGGSATCGGTGFFLGWLTLATSFRDKEFGAWLDSGDGYTAEMLIRPVVETA